MNWSIIKNELEHKQALERLEAIFDSKPGDPNLQRGRIISNAY